MMIVITMDCLQAQITKGYMMAEVMRGSWNMTCSSVTCTLRDVTVTSLHTCRAIQTVLTQKRLCKLVTDVMIIAGEVVALHH